MKKLIITAIISFISIYLPAATIYVDTDSVASHNGHSWQTAYHKLQDALAVAVSSDEIHIAQGVYRPDETFIEPGGTREQSATFDLAVDITLKGGYAGLGTPDPNVRDIDAYETILSGDLDENDSAVTNASQLLSDPNRSENSYHVISITGGTASLVLDGFTVTGGMAVGVDPHDIGGGIHGSQLS